VGKWLKAFGFGDDSGGRDDKGLGSEQLRRAMRIRETMRWRGFNLEPYTDEEIIQAADLLGEMVSADGETTEASREALAEALRTGLGSAPVTRMPAAPAPPAAEEEPSDEVPPPPSMPNPFEAEPPPEPEPAARPGPAGDTSEPATFPHQGETPEPVAATVAVPPGPASGRTALVRLRHTLGIHTWVAREDEHGPYLHCPGCQTDQRGRGAARKAARSQPRAPIAFPERESVAGSAPDEADPGVPRESAPQASTGTATGLLRWYVASPWWVKALSIFLVFQVVTVVVSVFSSG
jgi:hypothetical protein